MNWKDKFKKWLSDEGFTQWINYSAIDRLINYIDVDLLIGLKSELHIKNTLLKEEVKYLNHWISQIDSGIIKSQMNERIEFIEMELKKYEN